jgi:hypothetical protein
VLGIRQGGDRLLAGAQRQLCQSDSDLPARVQQPSSNRLEELAAIGRRLGRIDLGDRRLPLHIPAVLGEGAQKVVREPLRKTPCAPMMPISTAPPTRRSYPRAGVILGGRRSSVKS